MDTLEIVQVPGASQTLVSLTPGIPFLILDPTSGKISSKAWGLGFEKQTVIMHFLCPLFSF